MPRQRRRHAGFNRRGFVEHPGVTIGKDVSGGRAVVVLRYFDPAPAGHVGKRRKEIVYMTNGRPVTSREGAKAAAIAKSRELREEQTRINAGARATDFDGSWRGLWDAHKRYLQAKGDSDKTVLDYEQTWPFIDSWRGRPLSPARVTVDHLRGFVAHVKGYVSERTGRRLAPHSVAAVLRHFKAVLNYGRKELACVRQDAEAVNRGLQQGRLPRLLPVALTSANMQTILEKAAVHDLDHPETELFPLLAFLMLTGCRRGEAAKLRWQPSQPGAAESWVDLDGGRVVIYGEKTTRQRSIPLANRPALRALLEALKGASDTDAIPFVFGGDCALDVDNNGRWKRAIGEVQDAAGVAWRIKDFRSTYASYAANSSMGLNLYTLAGELGHDYAILVKHYAGQLTLPAAQARATTVEEVLGIAGVVGAWIAARESQAGESGGRVIPMRAA